ncbi:MAG: ribulose-phosphate 3-epimerase [Melioribacteraceae bacterium]|jgi:ribulose-phosphate 3-epimerase|nr:ribulose-phosphate 3-epimerase [Melioribacteraceae bacterium]
MRPIKLIAPSILSADFSNLSQQIRAAELGSADIIHCDIMDGHFVPNITFGPLVVSAVKKITKLPLDVHLMIENSEKYLESFVEAGASYLTIHQEANVHLDRSLNHIRELGAKPGVSINPATPISTIEEVLEIVDLILVMTVNPGFGGQKFIESTLRKVEKLAELKSKHGYNYLIEVDGGVSKDNIQKISNAGVNIFVAGNSVFAQDNITAAVLELKNLVN